MEGVEEIDGFPLGMVEGCLVGPQSGDFVCECESNERKRKRKRKRKLSDSDNIGSRETGGSGGNNPKRVQTCSSDHGGDGSVVEDNFQFPLVNENGPLALIDDFCDHSFCLGEPDCGPNPASTTGNSDDESVMKMLDLLDEFLDVYDGANWGSAVDQDHSPLIPSVSDAGRVINGGVNSEEEALILNILDDILADEDGFQC